MADEIGDRLLPASSIQHRESNIKAHRSDLPLMGAKSQLSIRKE